jgi:hypothetical protein
VLDKEMNKDQFSKKHNKQEANMKTKLSWFDRIMSAVTFAEANEHTRAKEILDTTGLKSEKEKKCTECDAILTTDMHGVEAHS